MHEPTPLTLVETESNIRTTLCELYETPLIFWDSPTKADEAIVGVIDRPGQEPFVVYERGRLIDLLADEFSDEEHPREVAEEWLEFNALGAWLGDRTPACLDLRALPSRVWVVGLVYTSFTEVEPGVEQPAEHSWGLVGIYHDRDVALSHCTTSEHFIAPFELNGPPLPPTIQTWPDIEWPNL